MKNSNNLTSKSFITILCTIQDCPMAYFHTKNTKNRVYFEGFTSNLTSDSPNWWSPGLSCTFAPSSGSLWRCSKHRRPASAERIGMKFADSVVTRLHRSLCMFSKTKDRHLCFNGLCCDKVTHILMFLKTKDRYLCFNGLCCDKVTQISMFSKTKDRHLCFNGLCCDKVTYLYFRGPKITI
jgi:hypothetical protein